MLRKMNYTDDKIIKSTLLFFNMEEELGLEPDNETVSYGRIISEENDLYIVAIYTPAFDEDGELYYHKNIVCMDAETIQNKSIYLKDSCDYMVETSIESDEYKLVVLAFDNKNNIAMVQDYNDLIDIKNISLITLNNEELTKFKRTKVELTGLTSATDLAAETVRYCGIFNDYEIMNLLATAYSDNYVKQTTIKAVNNLDSQKIKEEIKERIAVIKEMPAALFMAKYKEDINACLPQNDLPEIILAYNETHPEREIINSLSTQPTFDEIKDLYIFLEEEAIKGFGEMEDELYSNPQIYESTIKELEEEEYCLASTLKVMQVFYEIIGENDNPTLKQIEEPIDEHELEMKRRTLN